MVVRGVVKNHTVKKWFLVLRLNDEYQSPFRSNVDSVKHPSKKSLSRDHMTRTILRVEVDQARQQEIPIRQHFIDSCKTFDKKSFRVVHRSAPTPKMASSKPLQTAPRGPPPMVRRSLGWVKEATINCE